MFETAGSCVALLVNRRTGEEFNISRYSVSIGREIGNDIVVVTDKTISRQHALVQYMNGKFHVQDLTSKNGTRLNGRLVEKLTEIKSGDELALGLSQFVFMLVQGATAPGHAPILSAKTETVVDAVKALANFSI